MDNPVPPSDWLYEALRNLNNARDAMRSTEVKHREAAVYAITEAEKDIAHVIGILVEQVP